MTTDNAERKADKALQRIDELDKDTHLLKSQVGDIRVELKTLEKGQNSQNATLAALAVDVKYLRQRAEERERNGNPTEGKSNVAVALSVLAILAMAILQLIERL